MWRQFTWFFFFSINSLEQWNVNVVICSRSKGVFHSEQKWTLQKFPSAGLRDASLREKLLQLLGDIYTPVVSKMLTLFGSQTHKRRKRRLWALIQHTVSISWDADQLFSI